MSEKDYRKCDRALLAMQKETRGKAEMTAAMVRGLGNDKADHPATPFLPSPHPRTHPRHYNSKFEILRKAAV